MSPITATLLDMAIGFVAGLMMGLGIGGLLRTRHAAPPAPATVQASVVQALPCTLPPHDCGGGE